MLPSELTVISRRANVRSHIKSPADIKFGGPLRNWRALALSKLGSWDLYSTEQVHSASRGACSSQAPYLRIIPVAPKKNRVDPGTSRSPLAGPGIRRGKVTVTRLFYRRPALLAPLERALAECRRRRPKAVSSVPVAMEIPSRPTLAKMPLRPGLSAPGPLAAWTFSEPYT